MHSFHLPAPAWAYVPVAELVGVWVPQIASPGNECVVDVVGQITVAQCLPAEGLSVLQQHNLPIDHMTEIISLALLPP